MRRVRQVHPEFFTDSKVQGLPTAVAFAFLGLLLYVDDEGRGRLNLRQLDGFIHGDGARANDSVREALPILEGAGLIIVYEVNGERLIQVRNFVRHQSIDHPTPSLYPPPPDFTPPTFRPRPKGRRKARSEADSETDRTEFPSNSRETPEKPLSHSSETHETLVPGVGAGVGVGGGIGFGQGVGAGAGEGAHSTALSPAPAEDASQPEPASACQQRADSGERATSNASRLSVSAGGSHPQTLGAWEDASHSDDCRAALRWANATQHSKGPLLPALAEAWRFFRSNGRSAWDCIQLTLEALCDQFVKAGDRGRRRFSDGTYARFFPPMLKRTPKAQQRLTPPTPRAADYSPQHLPETDDRSDEQRAADAARREQAMARFARIGAPPMATSDLETRKRELQQQTAGWRSSNEPLHARTA